jgi:hypothetical protein
MRKQAGDLVSHRMVSKIPGQVPQPDFVVLTVLFGKGKADVFFGRDFRQFFGPPFGHGQVMGRIGYGPDGA